MRGSLQHPTVLDKASFVIYKSSNFVNYKSSVLLVVDGRREVKRAHYNTVVLIITILLIGHFFFLWFTSTSQVKSLKTVTFVLPHLAPNSSREILVSREY